MAVRGVAETLDHEARLALGLAHGVAEEGGGPGGDAAEGVDGELGEAGLSLSVAVDVVETAGSGRDFLFSDEGLEASEERL